MVCPQNTKSLSEILVFEREENLKISLLQEEAKIILGNSNKTALETCAMAAQPKHASRGRGRFP